MDKILLLDGAMGTMLQKAGLKSGEKPELFGMRHPDVVSRIHKRYMEAGSDVIYANTFGVNSRKLAGCDVSVPEVIRANIATAADAAASFPERHIRTALDVGPIGELMEPLGTLSFDEAYECFREIVTAGEMAGADLVVFETMTDLNEVRAAVLAAKENTSLPVWVTMTFEKTGMTFAGTDPGAMALTLDALGVDAMGVNCSLGPEDLVPIVEKIRSFTKLPLIVKPNAGLPDPRTGDYAMTPEHFARSMMVFPAMGVSILGGCCGTNPAFLEALGRSCLGTAGMRSTGMDFAEMKAGETNFAEMKAGGTDFAGPGTTGSGPEEMKKQDPCGRLNGVCSAGRVVPLDGKIRVVGECINPTGKKRLQQALREHDMDYVMRCAIEQAEAGADILDINVGLPGADEKALMTDVVRAVQSVTDLPLQIDSSNADVIEAGLRAACGRAIVNSVSADGEKCRQILPIVKKFGACVIGLALGRSGMPADAAGRIDHVKTILKYTDAYGIPRRDVIIDCLALTVSAQQEQAMETLHAVEYVSRTYGVHCTLGVSNISFGLPRRSFATVSFLTQAMYCGLDLPIINPNRLEIMDAVAAFRALSGQDVSCSAYIERFAGRTAAAPVSVPGPAPERSEGKGNPHAPADAGGDPLRKAVLHGLPGEVRALTSKLLESKEAMRIIEEDLIPALDEVGARYEKQLLFLPQLINSANAASAGFDLIKDRIAAGSEGISKGKIILATVEGDIHDIGKNIVKTVLENYGFTILDLGRDVPPDKILDAAKAPDIRLVGLSALMTTTLPAMEKTIRILKNAGCGVKVIAGGAVVTEQYAKEIGADYYAKDAKAAVDIARIVYGNAHQLQPIP